MPWMDDTAHEQWVRWRYEPTYIALFGASMEWDDAAMLMLGDWLEEKGALALATWMRRRALRARDYRVNG